MAAKTKSGWAEYRYDSLASFAAHLEARDRMPKAGHQSTADMGRNWAPITLEQCQHMAREGGYWPEGAAAMLGANADSIPDHLRPQRSPQLRKAPYGFLPHVGAAMAGDPLFLQAPGSTRGKRTFRIGVNVSISCATTAETATNVGRALLGMVDAIERAGVATEIVAYSANTDGKRAGCYMSIIIKPFDASWDPAAFAFVLANPSFCRRLTFLHREQCPHIWKITNSDYGTGDDRHALVADSFDAILPYLHKPDQLTESQAQEYVAKCLTMDPQEYANERAKRMDLQKITKRIHMDTPH